MTELSDLISSPPFGPLEDLMLGILRPIADLLPAVRVKTLIEPEYAFEYPTIFTRRKPGAYASEAFAKQNTRFISRGLVTVETFTEGIDGDTAGAWLQELCKLRLIDARRKNQVVPGVGSLTGLRIDSPAHRVNDWATSTGVVQYANLPKNVIRYEATYALTMRPDLSFDAANILSFI